MPDQRGILVATDLSARCDRAMERAFLLAREERVPLIILHVHEGKARLTEDEQRQMSTVIHDEFELAGADVDIVFDQGSVPTTVARVAEERQCALIVTGVARFNSPSDFILGTAVDYLVRKSPVPVLVVKRRAHEPYKKLLMPVDFSDADAHALLTASEIFENAEFRLVHAYQAAFQAFLEHDSTADFIHDADERSMERLVERLPASLRSRLDTKVVEGRLYPVLAQQIEEWRADLLVLGSKAPRGGYTHIAAGDDNWHVPAREPCDILIVRNAGPKPYINSQESAEWDSQAQLALQNIA